VGNFVVADTTVKQKLTATCFVVQSGHRHCHRHNNHHQGLLSLRVPYLAALEAETASQLARSPDLVPHFGSSQALKITETKMTFPLVYQERFVWQLKRLI